jgi:serine/threonine-protein kinase
MNDKTAPSPRDDLVGRTISGRYRIEERLAVGGMATVYRGVHIHMRKRVAVKVLRSDTLGFGQLAARFEREAIVGANVDHPRVAKATDFGFLDDGAAYLVMDYVEGITLRELMRRGPLPPARAAHIARQAADALAACHGLGVVHRDLKPRNIMVDDTRADRVKLIDFGLARVAVDRVSALPGGERDEAPTEPEITLRGVVFGTLAYMPPEIALGMEAVDERSDLYALGVVLYEMLAGAPPFAAGDPADVLFQKRSAPPPLEVPGVPAALERLTLRLMAPEPAQRPQSASEVVEEFDAVLDGLGQARPTLPSTISTLQLMPQVLKDGPPARAPSWVMRIGIPLGGAVLLASAFALVDYSADQNDNRAIEHAASTAAPVARTHAERAVNAAQEAAARRAARIDELREYVIDARSRGAWKEAAGALVPLLELDPSALDEKELASAAVNSAVPLEFEGEGDPLFSALAYKGGTAGLDVLYAIMSRKGGSRAARRAKELLADPEIRGRATPALRIALLLREARCEDKEALFERAGREGDERALVYLERLRSSRCDPRRGECCFHQRRALGRAIDALEKRGARVP